MEKRMLGKTGLEVSVIGFGAMTIGGMFGPVDDSVSDKALHSAVDSGVNFIDTSDAYGSGRSEELIGNFIKQRPDRDQVIVCTKGGNNMVTGKYNFTPEYIQGCVEGSLKRLGVEIIDLYLLHNPTVNDLSAKTSFDLLDDMKSQGKIKNWGVSVNTVEECELAVKCRRPSVIQMEYNILQQEASDVFARAREVNVGVISRVPLKRGFLSGRFQAGHNFAEGDFRSKILGPENISKFQDRLDKLRELATEMNLSETEAAIRFCVSNPNISTVIPGIRTPEQAVQNAAFNGSLPQEMVESINNI